MIYYDRFTDALVRNAKSWELRGLLVDGTGIDEPEAAGLSEMLSG